MDLAFAGIGILGILVWWRSWTKTSLDNARDRLFDLRDRNRKWFIENGYNLNHPLYKEMRDCINALLRYTETARFSTFVYMSRTIPKVIKADTQAQFENRFDTSDQKLRQHLQSTRGMAIRAFQRYMFETSVTLVIVGILAVPFAVLFTLHAGLSHIIENSRRATLNAIDRCILRPQTVEMIARLTPNAA